MNDAWEYCLEYTEADTGLTYGWSKEHPENEVFVGGTKEKPMKLLFNSDDSDGYDWRIEDMTTFLPNGSQLPFCLTDEIMMLGKWEEWAQDEIEQYFESLETDKVDRKVKQRIEENE